MARRSRRYRKRPSFRVGKYAIGFQQNALQKGFLGLMLLVIWLSVGEMVIGIAYDLAVAFDSDGTIDSNNWFYPAWKLLAMDSASRAAGNTGLIGVIALLLAFGTLGAMLKFQRV